MIEGILPGRVAAHEAYADQEQPALPAVEQRYAATAAAGRRHEFATARACARQALIRLGVTPAAIPRGARGEPVWPTGVVGSITHCAGYRAAAVALCSQVRSIGIDAEPNEPLPEGVLARISSGAEQAMLPRSADIARCYDRILFSAKESIYKAWYPLTRTWLDFDDVFVKINPDSGTFSASFLLDVPEPYLSLFTALPLGRFMVQQGLILTSAVIAADNGFGG